MFFSFVFSLFVKRVQIGCHILRGIFHCNIFIIGLFYTSQKYYFFPELSELSKGVSSILDVTYREIETGPSDPISLSQDAVYPFFSWRILFREIVFSNDDEMSLAIDCEDIDSRRRVEMLFARFRMGTKIGKDLASFIGEFTAQFILTSLDTYFVFERG